MYRLRSFYGQIAWDYWVDPNRDRQDVRSDLRRFQQDAVDAATRAWEVATYVDLVQIVSFLGVMNSRLELVFRGQRSDRFRAIMPTLYRDTWYPPPWAGVGRVPILDRTVVRARLVALGPLVYEICRRRGLPRWRTMQRVEAAQWSVIQHYELWPTPLLDVTRSLRVAASFALGLKDPSEQVAADDPPRRGHLYVIGLPNRTSSISYSLEDHLLAARLDAVCPPSAQRPHLQEGMLVTRFPVDPEGGDAPHYDLRRRAIAHLHLIDDGSFWPPDFPRFTKASLMPDEVDDPLAQDFKEAISYVPCTWGVDWQSR